MNNEAKNTHDFDIDSLKNEQLIKATLEQWIEDVQKKAKLTQRLQMALQNDKSHIQSLSKM